MTSTEREPLLCRGILVDMDGTLIDSNPIVETIWGEFCVTFGFDLPKLLRFSHGRLAIDTVRRYLPDAAPEFQDALVAQMQAKELPMNDLVKPVSGALEFVSSLLEQAVPWALVTSANYDIARIRFRVTGLPWPKVALTAEDVQLGKPSPEGYLTAAARVGLAPGDCVVFEDAGPGVTAGLAAGSTVVVVGGDRSEATANLLRVTDWRNVSVRPRPGNAGWFELRV